MIIGLAGTFGAGKDSFAHYVVKEYTYEHFSTSDMLRAMAEAEEGSSDRPTLLHFAKRMREEHGGGFLVEKALQDAKTNNVVISGLRAVAEADVIHANGGILVFVDADVHTRFERIKTRARDNEKRLTLEQFVSSELREMKSKKPGGQSISDLKEMADYTLLNNGSFEEFNHKLVQLMKHIASHG